MDTKDLMTKIQEGELTTKEQAELMSRLDEEMRALKETDPKKYLEFIKSLNEIYQELNTDIKQGLEDK